MSQNGLMIDIDACTGCHSCEVACKQEKNLDTGIFGIKVYEDKPFQIDADTWEYKCLPIPTQLCDLCESRLAKGKTPICVQTCCSHCMEYGDLSDLAQKMKDLPRRSVLFSI